MCTKVFLVHLLARAIPPGLDLRLVSGFITDGLGNRSGQIDCMVVRGEGVSIPCADHFIWHIEKVVAVFEVKKTLYSAQLAEAIRHLNEIKDIDHSYSQTFKSRGGETTDIQSAQRVYAETTGRIAPNYDELQSLPFHLEMLFHTLVMEHFSPLRIIIGYHGLKSEHGFRKALYEYFAANIGVKGFGVGNVPQLIVSGRYSLLKANGQPFSAPLVDDDWWPFYLSTPVNPILMILEAIWTRLDRLYDIGDPWGEDLELEVPHAFLLAKAGKGEGGQVGWHYRFVNDTAASLRRLGDVEDWEPSFLSNLQWVVINGLCQGKTVRFDDGSLISFLRAQGVEDLDRFWSELIETRLVAQSSDGCQLVLIATDCATAFLADGRIVAAENNTGRLFRWLNRNIERRE
ncbi:DUF6602 domain-containing protein [Streptomyces sp. B6B3]|uniref:DUF6602 domain-containing protein n=1 Tax=Streptomyces sp. B6B3 TaxID=3153570 RepID=UPI00325F4DE0